MKHPILDAEITKLAGDWGYPMILEAIANQLMQESKTEEGKKFRGPYVLASSYAQSAQIALQDAGL